MRLIEEDAEYVEVGLDSNGSGEVAYTRDVGGQITIQLRR